MKLNLFGPSESEPEWCDCADDAVLDGTEQTCLACGKPIYWLNEHVPPMTPARTPDGGSPAYRALLDEAWRLHIAKNTGYAGYSDDPWANFRQCEAFGIDALDGVLTRMSDKWSRLQSLWRNPERDQVGEPIQDTLKDMAAYALILVCLMEERVA